MKNEQIYELKYTGYLMDAENMYLHYGYTDWSNVSEKKMKKLKSCYKIEVSIPEGSELNFCFRANENEWDNNSGNNYWYTPGSNKSYDWVEITDKVTTTTTTKKTSTTSKAKATTKTATTTRAKSATSTSTTAAKKKTATTKKTEK